jgi:hypothetical protein
LASVKQCCKKKALPHGSPAGTIAGPCERRAVWVVAGQSYCQLHYDYLFESGADIYVDRIVRLNAPDKYFNYREDV